MLADATPAALTAHTRDRDHYAPIIDQGLNGLSNHTWTEMKGPDVYFGGGAEQFFPNEDSYEGKDYYAEFANRGYTVSTNKTALEAADPNEKALGVFCQGHMPVWLDRNVYKENLESEENDPLGGEGPATDLPGLKDMTLKAVEILHNRAGDEGFFLMSEAASIDKQMHLMDYDRALGDLLEFDDTIKATVAKLEELGVLDETLVVVSADHGHGFEYAIPHSPKPLNVLRKLTTFSVFGNADTEYIAKQKDDRSKRRGVGTYEKSGLSQYTEDAENGTAYNAAGNFPLNWTPRYAIAAGVVAHPDVREDYKVHESGPRQAAVTDEEAEEEDYYVNPEDSKEGFLVNGTLPVEEEQGVHSLTDVPVFAMGPCQELFGGVYSNIDMFYKMAECFGLGLPAEEGGEYPEGGEYGEKRSMESKRRARRS